MKRPTICIIALLAACAPVLNEQSTTVTVPDGYYRGEQYKIVTRTLQGRNGPYEQTRVQYRQRSAPCRLDSAGDCQKAASRLIDNSFNRGPG